MNVHVVEHPLIAHKLTMMRDKNCNSKNFRELLGEIASLMTYDVTKDWETEPVEIETGLGLLNGVINMIPHAHVGHIGLYRDPQTHKPVEYYCGLPKQLDAKCIVVDPMLATGGSAAAAITMLKEKGLHNICLMVLVAAPEGIKVYILPGLGDAGDRVFGTL